MLIATIDACDRLGFAKRRLLDDADRLQSVTFRDRRCSSHGDSFIAKAFETQKRVRCLERGE